MASTRGGPLPLVGLIVVLGGGIAPAARGAQSASQEPPLDACARLTPAEASQVLGAPVGNGQVRTHDMATECRFDTAGDEGRRLTLAFDVYQTGRAGLDGSAAAYFAQVRRASGHMGLRLEAVSGVGDEAYWMRGVLNVRKGEDLALAIEVSGVGVAKPADTVGEPAVEQKALALSKTVAAIILQRTNTASSARTGETVTIQSNTQAHLHDLSIGVGNIWEDAYTPEGGQPTRGLTAMLQIATSDGASVRQRPRVHAGQTLRVAGYVIRVLSITPAHISLTVARVPAR